MLKQHHTKKKKLTQGLQHTERISCRLTVQPFRRLKLRESKYLSSLSKRRSVVRSKHMTKNNRCPQRAILLRQETFL